MLALRLALVALLYVPVSTFQHLPTRHARPRAHSRSLCRRGLTTKDSPTKEARPEDTLVEWVTNDASVDDLLASVKPATRDGFSRQFESMLNRNAVIGVLGWAALCGVRPNTPNPWPSTTAPARAAAEALASIAGLTLTALAARACVPALESAFKECERFTVKVVAILTHRRRVAADTRARARLALACSAPIARLGLSSSISEEVLFRGLLPRAIVWLARGAVTPAAALATVAVVFGFAHAPNVSDTRPRVVYTISATIAGLIFARACAATGGGLLAPVIAHCAHNCVAGFVSLSDVTDAEARISERSSGGAPAAA